MKVKASWLPQGFLLLESIEVFSNTASFREKNLRREDWQWLSEGEGQLAVWVAFTRLCQDYKRCQRCKGNHAFTCARSDEAGGADSAWRGWLLRRSSPVEYLANLHRTSCVPPSEVDPLRDLWLTTIDRGCQRVRWFASPGHHGAYPSIWWECDENMNADARAPGSTKCPCECERSIDTYKVPRADSISMLAHVTSRNHSKVFMNGRLLVWTNVCPTG